MSLRCESLKVFSGVGPDHGAPPDYSGKAKVGTTNADGHATMQVTCTYDESHAVGAVTVTSKNPAGIDTAELTCDPVIKEEPRSSSGPG
jgi:hypothetical protein